MKLTSVFPLQCPLQSKTDFWVGNLHIVEAIDKVDAYQWNSFISPSNTLLHTDYLAAAEQSNPHVQFRYLSVLNKGEMIGVALFQLIDIEDGLRLTEAKTMGEKVLNKVKKTINNMNMRLLLCGNAFITGDFGYYVKDKNQYEYFFEGLQKAIEAIRTKDSANIVLIKDFQPEDLPQARKLTQYCYKEIGAQPNMELELHWDTFDDYLKALSSKYRVRLKKKIKSGKAVQARELTVEEAHQYKKQIHQFYRNSSDKAEFNLTFLSEDYFVESRKALEDRFFLVGYFLEDRLVAFMSYFIVDDLMESHFVGYEAALNNQHALYYNILIDHVRFAIEKGLKGISLGRTALESKGNIGAQGKELNSFIWSSNRLLYGLAKPLFDSMKGTYEPRNAFKKE